MPLGPGKVPASLAAEYDWVSLSDKTADISAALDSLTLTILKLLAAAYGIIVLGVLVYYRQGKKTLKVAAIPLFALLVSMAVHILLRIPLSFFSVSGFILVLGLGLDYMFYLAEDKPRTDGQSPAGELSSPAQTRPAVILSYVTTAISFGALLFSSFVPVRLLALGVFPGLSAAFICAFLLED
jgi:predicted exporter